MKVQQLNLSQNNNQNQQNKLIRYNRFNSEQDTFTRTTVSFKGAEENIYKKILNNPTLAQKFMGLIAAGATALIAAANIEEEEIKTNSDDGNILTNLFSGLLGQNKNTNEKSEIEKIREENQKLITENEELKAKLNEKITNNEPEAKTTTTKEEKTAESVFVFPKKRGRLSNNQQELKITSENLNITEEDVAQKLTMLCEELLTKNSHIINNQEKDNEQITKDLTEELKSAESDCQIKYIINKYLSLCGLVQNEVNSNNGNQINDPNFIGLPKPAGVKVLGKIELPAAKKKAEKHELIIRDEEGNITSIFFKKAGTTPEYSAAQLDEVLKFFIKTIYNDYKEKSKLNPELKKPKWLYNVPLPQNIRKTDIEKEIKKQKVNPEEQYVHIQKEDVPDIVNAINEDPRYNDLFDIHSALRLFDRYVDFNSDCTGIDIQSQQILDKLFEMIEKSYKDGFFVDVYKDKESGFIGPSITLKAENFDREAIDLFGPTDIVIGISERQSGKVYKGVENNRKEAIISTIYPKD